MIRVHESYNDQFGGTAHAFNLDDFGQFVRYVETLVAKPGRWVYDALTTQRAGEGKIEYRTIGNGRELEIFLTAQKVERHGQCKYCELYFDPTAGNGNG